MSLRRNLTTGEIRDISDEQLAAWIANGNPKGEHYSTQWELYTPPEPEPVVPQPYRVSKDTIISRVTELGALSLVMSALSQQTAEQQFVWTHSAWFWSDNATLRGLCQALQLEAEVVLAPDPYIT